MASPETPEQTTHVPTHVCTDVYIVYVFIGLIHDCKRLFKVNCCHVFVIFQVKGHEKNPGYSIKMYCSVLAKIRCVQQDYDILRHEEQNTVTKVHRDFSWSVGLDGQCVHSLTPKHPDFHERSYCTVDEL